MPKTNIRWVGEAYAVSQEGLVCICGLLLFPLISGQTKVLSKYVNETLNCEFIADFELFTLIDIGI